MWYRLAHQKKMIITRGLPGSGKSTKASELGVGGVVLGSDDFWGPDYDFDISRIGEAHRWNQKRVLDAIQDGVSPIVVDNTNVSLYEIRPCLEMAQAHDYQIEIIEADTPWKFDAEELAKRNKHGVSQENIQKMIDRWDDNPTTERILESVAPWEQLDNENN